MSNRNQNKAKRQTKRSGTRGNRNSASEHVTEYQSSPVQNRKFRFQAAEAFSGDILVGAVSVLAGIATAVNTLSSIYSQFKINRVQIWSSGTNGDLKLDPISLKYYSNNSSDVSGKTHSDYGNANRLAYLSHRPLITDLASFYNGVDNATAALFNISLNQGDIIDLDMSIVFDSFTNAGFTGTATTTSLMVVDNMYYYYLDGSTTHSLKPSINTPIF